MNGMADHAKPPARKDHLWVLAVIAACALLEVWASWLGIGSVSGFPKLGKMTTGWILPVTTEAYWGYAVWAWLASSPGPRSRRFAMWTAIVMFTLSLGGQEAGHLVAAAHRQAPPYVVAFVTALPLIAVGLIAILIHLRQADREEAEAAARAQAEAARLAASKRAEADDRAALRAELEAAREELAGERKARAEAEREAGMRVAAQAEREEAMALLEQERAGREAADAAREEAVQRAEKAEAKAATLARKAEANRGAKGTRNTGAGNSRKAPATAVPSDVDARVEAMRILAETPDISGAKLGELCGKSERWGQLRKSELATHVADGGSQPGGTEAGAS